MTKSQVDEAAQLYAAGVSLAAVAEHMGFDRKTIRKRLDQAGVVLRASNRRGAGGTPNA